MSSPDHTLHEENRETFEDYVSISDEHTKSFEQIIDKHGVFGYVKTMIPDLQGKYRTQPREGYTFILWNCKYLYKMCKEKDLLEYPAMRNLMKGLYHLDTKCGNTSEINHALDDEEFMNRLHIIDQDREKFKYIFLKDYFRISEPVLRTVFIEFSRLVFKFNGYQAPFRLDPKKALEDAMGLTDLFGEFLKEVQISLENL